MKKLKSVKLNLELDGKGIVNFDGKNQRYLMSSCKQYLHEGKNKVDYFSNDNIKLAKKEFFKDENGNLDYRIKISSDCLRRHIYTVDTEFINSIALYNDNILCNFIGSVMGLTRGYLFAPKGGEKPTYKRKSPLTISSAIQSKYCTSIANIEACSNGGDTCYEKDNIKRSETSLYYKESIGEIKYNAEGFIDIQSLQLISADSLFDRKAVNPDWCVNGGIYDQCLKNCIGDDYGKYGYFTLNSKLYTNRFAENSILLNNKSCIYLIKEILKRILSLSINRNNAYAKLSNLIVTLEYEGECGVPKEIKNIDDIDKLFENVEVYQFYCESSEEEVTLNNVQLKKYFKEYDEKKRVAEEEKKRLAEEKKKKAKNKKDESDEDDDNELND